MQILTFHRNMSEIWIIELKGPKFVVWCTFAAYDVHVCVSMHADVSAGEF